MSASTIQPASADPGLTTTKSPFIEQAQHNGELFIEQPYELYSEENQETWRRLYARQLPYWRQFAHPRFLEGVDKLALNPDRIPRLSEINQFLAPLSGFKAKAVSGYIPGYLFFDCLRKREFPTTITIRGGQSLDYLPEPDIFHDVAGHVPMHTGRIFSDVLVRFGEVAHTAALRAQESTGDEHERLQKLESVIRALSRFFWFTVEFGLMNTNEGVRAYGSGLLSSHGELEYALESPNVQRFPYQLEWAVNQHFEIHHFQPLLFVVDSFDHLFNQVGELERWMKDGKLDNVAPGEPVVKEEDLKSFLHMK